MKDRKKPIHLLTPDDVDALAASCSRTAPSGIRDSALIMLLYGAGLRVSEALALLPADVDLDARQVYVRRGKGGFERRVGLLPAAVPWIERWVRKRGELCVGRSRPLFCAIAKGKTGKPVSRQAVDAMLKRRGRKAGLEVERIHAHALRHSLAVRMHAKMPAAAVMAQLGHASLATTSRYLAHLSGRDLAEGMTGI
jgi:site-specific recombinase XerD